MLVSSRRAEEKRDALEGHSWPVRIATQLEQLLLPASRIPPGFPATTVF